MHIEAKNIAHIIDTHGTESKGWRWFIRKDERIAYLTDAPITKDSCKIVRVFDSVVLLPESKSCE